MCDLCSLPPLHLTASSPSTARSSQGALSCQRHVKLLRAHAVLRLPTYSSICPHVAVDRRPLSWWGRPRGSACSAAAGCTQAASESFNTPFLMARDHFRYFESTVAPWAGRFQASHIFFFTGKEGLEKISYFYLSCLSETSRNTPLLIITAIIILNKSHSDHTLACKYFLLICILPKDHANMKPGLFLNGRIKLAR